MLLDQLGLALNSGAVNGLNIITHSGLNRYGLQVLPREGAAFLLSDQHGRPRFWLSLVQLRESLRRHGITAPPLHVIVAHDEIIGR